MDDNGLVSSLLLSPGHLVYQVNHAGSASGSTILRPRHEVELFYNTGGAGQCLGRGGRGEEGERREMGRRWEGGMEEGGKILKLKQMNIFQSVGF